MSTNAIVKFYLNDKTFVGKAVCINKLKKLLDGWNLCEELVPFFNSYVKDAGDYWYRDFAGYVLKNEDIGFPVVDGEIELPKDFNGKILFSENLILSFKVIP